MPDADKENRRIIGDKAKAYEQGAMEERQENRSRAMQELSSADTQAQLFERNRQLEAQLIELQQSYAALEKNNADLQVSRKTIQETAEKKVEQYRSSTTQLKQTLAFVQETAEVHRNDSNAAQKLIETFATFLVFSNGTIEVP